MLVYETVRSCSACGKGFEASKLVDISFEEIRLSPTTRACDCGYFKEFYHYQVSFHDWKVAVKSIKSRLESFEKDLEIEEKVEKEFGVTVHSTARKEHIKLVIQNHKDELERLGTKPIPDHLFKENHNVKI